MVIELRLQVGKWGTNEIIFNTIRFCMFTIRNNFSSSFWSYHWINNISNGHILDGKWTLCWEVFTDKNLRVKHLKITGSSYTFKSKFSQGIALYCMRFGIILSILTLIKSSYNSLDITKLFFGVSGYIYSFISRKKPIVSVSEGEFIRNYRWDSFKKKYFLKN